MKKALLVAFGLTVAAVAVAQSAPADIVYENAAVGNTTFSHTTHIAKGAACTDCHTAIFQMAKNSAKMTMADMNAGKNCGTCHNGTKAFATTECAKCHKK